MVQLKAKLRMTGRALGRFGQVTGEGCARSRLAFQGHPAAMQLHQRLDQGQAKTWAAALAADEAVEDVRLDVEWDAAPGVGDLQADLADGAQGPQGDHAVGRGL